MTVTNWQLQLLSLAQDLTDFNSRPVRPVRQWRRWRPWRWEEPGPDRALSAALLPPSRPGLTRPCPRSGGSDPVPGLSARLASSRLLMSIAVIIVDMCNLAAAAAVAGLPVVCSLIGCGRERSLGPGRLSRDNTVHNWAYQRPEVDHPNTD